MKRLAPFILALMLLASCQNRPNAQMNSSSSAASSSQAASDASSSTPSSEAADPVSYSDAETENHILIVYFTMPEDVDITGVDAIAGASVVVREGEKLGNCEFAAKTIQAAIGGDLFQIETVQQYPLDHEPLIEQASDEKAEEARPELMALPENLEQYDTVILGYPNWWGDLPMPVYTFLESCDLSGKTIIPFTIHGGSRFSGTIETIGRLQPEAAISENTLCLSRNDAAKSEADITAWAEGLGLD